MIHSTYTLGIDPAKQKFTACLLADDGVELVSPTDLEASRTGFDQMLAIVRQYVPAEAHLVVGIESSSALDDNLLALFASAREELRVTLIRVDAAQVKHFSGARPHRGKCDKADARRIARFTQTYAGQLSEFLSEPELLAMQRLINERLALAEDAAAQKNRLKDRLVISFPEFTCVFDDPSSATALAVLRKAPTAAHLAKKRLSTIEKIRHPAPGSHKVGTCRAKQLKQLAMTSVASATTDDDGRTIERLADRIELLNEQIAEIELRLGQFASRADKEAADESHVVDALLPLPSISRQIQLLDTIPGIALVSAAAIVLRSRGITRFTTPKALAAQLAACPERNQTGSSMDTGHLSYRGDRRARGILYMASMAAVRTDVAMAFQHWRLVQAGKTSKQAHCACMNRMLRIAWTLVRNNTPYDKKRAIDNAQKHHPELWKSFLDKQAELGKNPPQEVKKSPKKVLK